MVKLAKENEEWRVDAVVCSMMPLLPDVSYDEALVFAVEGSSHSRSFHQGRQVSLSFQAHCVGIGVSSSLLITRTSRLTSHKSQEKKEGEQNGKEAMNEQLGERG